MRIARPSRLQLMGRTTAYTLDFSRPDFTRVRASFQARPCEPGARRALPVQQPLAEAMACVPPWRLEPLQAPSPPERFRQRPMTEAASCSSRIFLIERSSANPRSIQPPEDVALAAGLAFTVAELPLLAEQSLRWV